MNDYVLGFMFSADFGRVLLIQKNKPEWQAGKLNGIGGKVEPGEQPFDAMVREFREETGLENTREQWTHFGHMTSEGWNVELFACVGDWTTAENTTDEILHEVPVAQVRLQNTIQNLPLLISAAEHALVAGLHTSKFKLHLQYL